MPGRRGLGLTEPNACCTPTSPALMTTAVEPTTTRTPTMRAARLARRSAPPTGRAPSDRTADAPMRRKKATARSTKPKTRLPMATPDSVGDGEDLREQVRAGSRAFGEGRFLLAPSPDVSELLAARDTFFSDEPLEHQLARRHHRRGILLAAETDLIDQREQPRHDGEALEQR